MQFTLFGGALYQVLERYQALGGAWSARFEPFMTRVQQRDRTLVHDLVFLDLLQWCDDPLMQAAQWSIATALYWKQAVAVAGIYKVTDPLGLAYLFDTAVQLGAHNANMASARADLSAHSVTARQVLQRAAARRSKELNAQAARENLPGLIGRGAFWVERMRRDDWGLQGTGGMIEVKEGARGIIHALG